MKTSNDFNPLKCVIVDDDPQFVFFLSTFVNDVPTLKLCGTYLDSQHAIDGIKESDEIDFLFLDIRMGNISGIEIAEQLRDKVKYIIFISASGKYALNALQVGGDHYLVKPVTFPKFLHTVNEVLKRNNSPKLLNV